MYNTHILPIFVGLLKCFDLIFYGFSLLVALLEFMHH